MGAVVAGRPTSILHLAPWLNRPRKKGIAVISAATACETGADEASPGKIKHFSSINPAPGKALRLRLGHPFRKRGELSTVSLPQHPSTRVNDPHSSATSLGDGREHDRGVVHRCCAQRRRARC